MNIQPVRQQPRPRAATIYASPGQYAVISVGDGDTIRIRTSSGKSVTVRLACIDAPETAQGQSGRDSTDQLRALLSSAGGVVQLQPKETDRYGRTVAEVLAAGRNVNLELVRLGAAYVYRDYLRGCNASAYTQAENEARTSRAGVWQYVMEYPWDFRKSRRK
jgi:endonuclease YncB( thermonuclease family)